MATTLATKIRTKVCNTHKSVLSDLSRPVPSQAWVMHGLEEDDYLHAFMDPDEALARCLQDEEDRIF